MSVPLAYYHDWGSVPTAMRNSLVNEFKANGADNFVAVCTLMAGFIKDPSCFGDFLRFKKDNNITFTDVHMPYGEHMDLACPDRGRREEALRQKKAIAALGLPVELTAKYNSADVIQAMLGDKKSASGKINLVLPTRIGHVEIIKDASAEKIARAVESIYA